MRILSRPTFYQPQAPVRVFAHSLRLPLGDLAHETEFGGAAALPVANHSLTLGEVVAVHEMMRRLPSPVRHGANRQHEGRPCVRRRPWNAPSWSSERDTIPVVLVDAGVENVNAQVDALIHTGVLRGLLAFTELKFSNSMIEAWWRSLKHQWHSRTSAP